MANAEQTFADRLARGRTMQSKIDGFEPAFAPADASLDPTTFDTFLDSVQAANLAVSTAAAAENGVITLRQELMKQVKDRATRVVNYVGSNEAWDQYLPAVKQAADKVRNFRPKKKTTPLPPTEGDTAKKRMTGQGSYGDVDRCLRN